MERILIVEDEPLIAMMLSDWVIELGKLPVGPAGRVSEALELIGSTSVDAALVDVNLRHERSDAVAAMLAERQIPFALTTGESGDSHYPQHGHLATLPKPYDFESLQKVIEALCRAGSGSRPAKCA